MATIRGEAASPPCVEASEREQHGEMRSEAEVLERLWGWRACDRCGETVMLGEEMLRVPVGERTEEICLGCVGMPGTRAAADPGYGDQFRRDV